MKMQNLLLITISVFTLLFGCSTKKGVESSTPKNPQSVAKQEQDLWNTDYSLFEKAQSITVCRLNAVGEITETDKTIAQYKVVDEGKALSKKQAKVLKSLVSSPLSYSKKTTVNKKLFMPYFAYQFKAGKKSLFLLVDISADEWAVATQEALIQHKYNTCQKELAQLGSEIYPDDEYIKTIIKTIKDNEK